jgi:hypothetical protein
MTILFLLAPRRQVFRVDVSMISMIIADLPKLFFSFVVSLLCDVILLTAAVQFHISTISPLSSGPLGKFGNSQPHHKRHWQGMRA